MELKNALMQNEEVLAALLDIAENGDGHVYKKDFIRTVRTIKPLGGKAEASNPPRMNQPPMPKCPNAPVPQCTNAAPMP